MFGDFSGGGESPESEDSAAGTTPAEPAAESAPETASEDAAPADGTSETLSDGTTPAAAPESAEPSDPFQDTTAASYMLNGQPVSVEDIRVFKEGGAVIRPESLPNVLSKLAERDTLSTEVRTAKQQYDTLSKVIAWTDQASGKAYTGADAAIENRIANAALFAENALMLPVFQSGDLESFLTTKPMLDASGRQLVDGNGKPREVVVFRPDFLQSLAEKAQFQREQIDFATRKHYAGVIAESSKAQPAPVNFETAAPELVKLVAQSAQLDASVLTPEDKATLAEQLPFHLKDGMASIAWQNLAKRLMTSRAQQKTSAQAIASTTADATKKGLANMAAAARGLKAAAPKAAAIPAPQLTPAQARQSNEGDLYDSMQRAASKAMRASI